MSNAHTSVDCAKIFLLNRDHIISVATTGRELVVTTTFGKLVVSGESKTIAEFQEELANDVRSNFVSVPLSLSATVSYETAQSE